MNIWSSYQATPLLALSLLATNVVVERAVAQAPPDGFVEGRVWSADGWPVEGALVRIVPASDTADVGRAGTDALGYFRIDGLSPGPHWVLVSGIGFAEHRSRMDVDPSGAQTEIKLDYEPIELAGLQVSAARTRERVHFEESAGETVHEIGQEGLKSIPVIAESDPLRAVETLPGVTTVSDFTAAFNVRGGSADQNLYLLDRVPIYNPFHLLGIFSVFNADMVGRAELRSGGFPAEYGGRVSSVLSVDSDAGDGQVKVDGGVSLLASRVAVSGSLPPGMQSPLGLANSRWRVSGRRSYVDWISRPVSHIPYRMAGAHGVFEGWTKGGSRVRLTGYSGRDGLNMSNGPLGAQISWGNDAFGGSWVNPIGGGGRVGVHGSLSRFAGDLDIRELGVGARTWIRRMSIETDIEHRPLTSVRWKSGALTTHRSYESASQRAGALLNVAGGGVELAGYSQLQWADGDRWLLEAGARLDHWRPEKGDAITTLSPRVALKRFLMGGDMAVRFAAGRYSQFEHSMRDEWAPIGMDMWVISGEGIPHVVSDHAQAGLEAFWGQDNSWHGSVEFYYRTLDGVVTHNLTDDPADPLDDLVAGTGRAYGADLLVKRMSGNWMGWLAVSLLRSSRTFPDTRTISRPRPTVTYPPVYDRLLDIDLVLRRELDWWDLDMGLRANFGTGRPETRPIGDFDVHTLDLVSGKLVFGSVIAAIYGDRNQARFPVRHRLDVSFRKVLQKSWGTVTPYLSVLNIYNKKNVLFYWYEYYRSPPKRTGVSMFPILPTFGVEVSF